MGGAWLRGQEKDGIAVDRHGNDANNLEEGTTGHGNKADEHKDDPDSRLKFLRTLTGLERIP